MKYNCEIEAKDFKVNGESINKGLSVSETGTGNVITDVAVNGHNIMVTKGNVEVTEETPLSITTDGEGNVISDLTVAGHSITAKKITALTSSDLDNATIKLVDGKIVAETLNGLTVTVAELNNLQGLDFNVKEKLSSLGNAMSFYGVFNTKALLLAETTPRNGATAIVRQDESNNSKQMSYVYVGTGEYDSNNWTVVAENSIEVRDFSVNPINLGTETIGKLSSAKVTGLSTVATSGSYNDLADIPNVCLQVKTLPTEANTGAIVQYVGETTESYTQGNFYQWNGTAWSKVLLGESNTGKGISGTGEKSEICNNTENNIASGNYSHAEGDSTTASGYASHAEGIFTKAIESCSHAEGNGTEASGGRSHAEGYCTIASGLQSHAEGSHTIAKGKCQHVFGKYNVEDSESTYAEIVGNGTDTVRLNARTLDWSGNEVLTGSCTAKDFILSSGMSMTKPVTKNFTRNTTNCASIFSSNIECLGSLRVANIDMTSAINFESNKAYVLATMADTSVRPKVNKGINVFTNKGVQARLSIQSNGKIQLVPTSAMAAGDGIRTLMVWIS